MIIVDSSVWIDYFGGVENRQTNTMDDILGQRIVAVGDLIVPVGLALSIDYTAILTPSGQRSRWPPTE